MKKEKSVSFYNSVGFWGIVALFLFGVDISSSSGGFIALRSPEINYDITNAFYIAVLFSIIAFAISFKQDDKKSEVENRKYAKIYAALGILGFPLFYLISPDFRFYHTPAVFQYRNLDDSVEVEEYVTSYHKYCEAKSGDNFSYKSFGRYSYCQVRGKLVSKMKTADEYIYVLDYANKHSLKSLYGLTFRGAESFGLEEIIEKYENDTFYAKVIIATSDKRLIQLIKSNTKRKEVIYELIDFNNEKIDEFQDLLEKNEIVSPQNYWEDVNYEYRKKIKEIDNINEKVF